MLFGCGRVLAYGVFLQDVPGVGLLLVYAGGKNQISVLVEYSEIK